MYPLSEHVSVGARVRLDRHAEEELAAGLFLGPVHLHAGVHHPLLSGALKLLGLGRAVTDAEVYMSGGVDDIEGPRVIASGHLLDDDHMCSKASRAARVDLTALLLGKVQRGEPVVVDEREVTVCLPEGSFTTTARVMERQLSRPRGLFKRWERWVEFASTPVLVPWKGGGMGLHNMGGPTSVTGRTIEDGIGELTRRVLEQRARYGGRDWKHGPPATPMQGDSHEVSVWRVNGPGQIDTEAQRFTLHHGAMVPLDGRGGYWCRLRDKGQGSLPLRVQLGRDQSLGAVTVAPLTDAFPVTITRAGATRPVLAPALVFQNDVLTVGGASYRVYGSPIGPLHPVVADCSKMTPEEYRAHRAKVLGQPQPSPQQVASDVAEVAAQLDTSLSPGEAEEAVEDAHNLLAEVLLDPETAQRIAESKARMTARAVGIDMAAPGEHDRTAETMLRVMDGATRIESVRLIEPAE